MNEIGLIVFSRQMYLDVHTKIMINTHLQSTKQVHLILARFFTTTSAKCLLVEWMGGGCRTDGQFA